MKRDRNQSIEHARAAKRRLDAARAAIESLDPDERAALFVDLEDELDPGDESSDVLSSSSPPTRPRGRPVATRALGHESSHAPAKSSDTSAPAPAVDSEYERDCVTLTYRMPPALKRRVEEMAEQRGMTVTRLVIEALENEVAREPPRWFAEWAAGRNAKREPLDTPELSFVDKAEKFVLAHPEGVRTHEVAEAIDQTASAAFGTLMLLERNERVSCTGRRNKRLWTPRGVKPVPRIETIDAALVKVLNDADGERVDGITLRERAVAMVVTSSGKKPRLDSTVAAIYRLVREGKIKKDGANERGPLYRLPNASDKADEEGGPAARVLN